MTKSLANRLYLKKKLHTYYTSPEGHIKRDFPMKKSSEFVKKGKRDQDFDTSNDKGNAYFGEALRVVRNDEMTELVMNSGESYHMTHKRGFLYDFKVVDGGLVQLGLKRSLISLGTLEKEGYTMKMQMGRIKVIKGCLVMMAEIRKKNCVYTLKAKVMTFWCTKAWSFKTSWIKQRGHKQVRFKQIGPGVETRLYGVQEQEKVHLDIKVRANIMITGVPGQEGSKGNIAKKKNVKESMEANLGKVLQYNVNKVVPGSRF
nr:retrovirus-related Pol polyprotein from transposon TNT 1-94 [Tanacetum cinerariifolium]